MKNAMFSAPARTDILAGIAVLVLRFLIESVAGDNLIFLLLSFPMWLIAWTAITIGMAKLGKREDWRSGLHERAKTNALLSVAVSASARIYIIAGIALHLLLVLMAIVLPDNFMIGVFRLLLTWIAWGAIAVGVVRIGNRKGWWSGLSERSDPVGSIDMRNLRLFGSPMISFAIGAALILLGLVVRSMAFLEFLYDTKFLFELLVEVDQGLWPLYEPLYSALGTKLHNLSPTLGVLGWLGILSGIAVIVIAVIRMLSRNDTPNRSG